MSTTPSRLVGFFLLALIGGALAWFMTDGFGTNTTRGVRSGPAVADAPDDGLSARELSSSESISEKNTDGTTQRDAVIALSAATPDEEFAGELVTWTGRISWAAGTPADEQGEVLILSSLTERAPFWDQSAEGQDRNVLARVPVGSDGTFTLEAPTGEERWIDLEARYGYLDRPLVLPTSTRAPLEIAPRLGAWLVGTATVPKSVEKSELATTAVTLEKASGGGMDFRRMMDSSRRELEGEIDAQAKFEIRGIPALSYTLQVAGSITAPFKLEELELRAGERRELKVTLAPGGSVAGILLDANGSPIADVRVRAEKEGEGRRGFGPPQQGGARSASSRTDERGQFLLRGMQAGAFDIKASGAPLLKEASSEVSLAEGQTIEGIELTGSRGGSLTGRVTWPDGTPVREAEVAPAFDEVAEGEGDRGTRWREAGRLRRLKVTTDERGRFEIAGLNPKYRYTITSTWDASTLADFDSTANADGARVMGFAESGSITIADGPLNLVLTSALPLVGMVQSPHGTPVTSFGITAKPKSEGGWGGFGGGDDEISKQVDNADGEFMLLGLTDGIWTLDVMAEGYASPADKLEVEWPAVLDGPPPILQLALEARVTARVVDPFGNLVPGAEVRDVTSNWRDRMQGEGRELSKRTDAYGSTTLTGLQEGRYRFAAFADGFAPSEPLDLVLEPGMQRSNVELALTSGGRIEGTLQDPDGDIEDRMVMLTAGSDGGGAENNQMARTDAQGRFEFSALPAGSVTLMAMPAGGFSGGGRPSMAGMESATAEVIDKETTYIELGSPPADPITVTGRVTAGGEPVEGEVMFIAAGENVMAGMETTSTDEEGFYTMVLDGPGNYQGNARPSGRRSRAYYRTVSVTADTTIDFEIPSGSITGTVFENGEPKRNARISIVPDGPLPPGAMLGAQFQGVSSSSEGTYTISGLDAGSYRLSLGGGMRFGGGSVSRSVLSGIEVQEDETTSGVDFELETAGKVEVSVTDETGQPAASGALFVRDANGVVVNPVAMSSRSTDGKYTVDGLMPGIFSVSFQGDGRASVESDPFEVKSDETTQLELSASTGSKLIVKVLDGDGEPIDVSIEIFDSQGKAFHGMLAMARGFGPPEGGWMPGQETYGPLPAGTYTVRAVHADGRDSKRKVKLSGQPERKLTMRLR